MDAKNALVNCGLSEKEADVYMAALSLGSASVSEIAKVAKIHRVSTYDVLQKLLLKSYVSMHIEKGVKVFSAVDPDALRKEMRERYMQIKAAAPDLKRIYGKKSHPNIRYYEGIEGVKKMYENSLQTKSSILNYADSRLIRKHWPSYDKDYVAKRVKKGIFLKGLAPYDEYSDQLLREKEQACREIRFVHAKEHSFENEIMIYDDKVAIISYSDQEILGVLMESKEIAETQKAIFDLAWSGAAREKKSKKTSHAQA